MSKSVLLLLNYIMRLSEHRNSRYPLWTDQFRLLPIYYADPGGETLNVPESSQTQHHLQRLRRTKETLKRYEKRLSERYATKKLGNYRPYATWNTRNG